MSKQLKELLNSLGAISEVAKLLYDDFIEAGFTEEQAFSLVQTYIQVTFFAERSI